MKYLKIICTIVFLIGSSVWILSYFYEPAPPTKIKINSLVRNEPIQTRTKTPEFSNHRTKYDYTITPLYNYELNALVLSHGKGYDVSEDPLNTNDMCVVWGNNNTRPGVYENIAVDNYSFWCTIRSKLVPGSSSVAGKYFKYNELSNNHLLPATKQIEDQLKTIKRGDQVHIKGYLVRYKYQTSNGSTRTRSSSISRDDISQDGVLSDQGSCETIYITEFKLLSRNQNILVTVNKYSPYATIIGLILLVWLYIVEALFARPHAATRYIQDQVQSTDQLKAEIEAKLRSYRPDR